MTKFSSRHGGITPPRRDFLKAVRQSAIGGLLLRAAPAAIGATAVSLIGARAASADCPGAMITLSGAPEIDGKVMTAVNINIAPFFDGTSLSMALVPGFDFGCTATDYLGVAGHLVVTQGG